MRWRWSWAAGASVEAGRWDEERREKRGSSGRRVERAGRGDVISLRERETRERVWSPKLEMGWKKTTTRPVPGDAGASLPAQCLHLFGTGCTAPRVSLTIQSLGPIFSFFRLAIAASPGTRAEGWTGFILQCCHVSMHLSVHLCSIMAVDSAAKSNITRPDIFPSFLELLRSIAPLSPVSAKMAGDRSAEEKKNVPCTGPRSSVQAAFDWRRDRGWLSLSELDKAHTPPQNTASTAIRPKKTFCPPVWNQLPHTASSITKEIAACIVSETQETSSPPNPSNPSDPFSPSNSITQKKTR